MTRSGQAGVTLRRLLIVLFPAFLEVLGVCSFIGGLYNAYVAPLSPDQLSGTYRYVYADPPLGEEWFTLLPDGTYSQRFRYADGRVVRAEGRWSQDGRRGVLFEDSLQAVDPFNFSRSAPEHPARINWFKEVCVSLKGEVMGFGYGDPDAGDRSEKVTAPAP
jgi:hypothetical protein